MIYIVTLCVFLIVIAIMSVGVIFGKREIKGSCGGVGGCGLCGADGDNKLDPMTGSGCKEQERAGETRQPLT